MIAVVTGGSGFLGRNLVDRLLRDGHTVRCLVRPRGGAVPRKCAAFVVDYATPSSLIDTKAFDGADVVFHLAGVTKGVRERDFQSANVVPTRHILGALVAKRLQPRFIYVSSQAAAGPAISLREPVVESDPPRPVEAYGRSKLESERVVESVMDRVPATVLRPCAIFGRHDRDFLTLFRWVQRGWLPYPGVRQHWLSVLHVDDVVDALLTAATSLRAIGRTYFVSSAEPVEWSALGGAIAKAVGRSATELDIPRPLVVVAAWLGELVSQVTRQPTLANRNKAALSRDPFWVCSGARARMELGLSAERALPEALRETYLWYLAQGWLR